MEKRIYFDHITVNVPALSSSALGKAVVQFIKKLIGNPKRCLGYYISCDSVAADTVADVSININGEGSICDNVRPALSYQHKFIPLNIELMQNSIITGHIEDLGSITAPYNITITLKLFKWDTKTY